MSGRIDRYNWLGLFLLSLGANIAVTAVLLNLFRLSMSSKPIFILMLAEAAVPIFVTRYLLGYVSSLSIKSNLLFAGMMGTCGSLSQLAFPNSIVLQILGIGLTTVGLTIFKPVLILLPTQVSNTERNRGILTSQLAFMQSISLLIGYILSGFFIDRTGYESCFAIALACFILSTILFVIFLPKHIAVDVSEENLKTPEPPESHRPREWQSESLLWILVAGYWITGGAINVLEVPLAKKVLDADEFSTTLLFFAVALGSITFSYFSKFFKPKSNLYILAATNILMAILVCIYVSLTSAVAAMLVLFHVGLLSSAHSIYSSLAVQSMSTRSKMTRNSFLLNAIIQGSTLLSAGAAVLLAEYMGEVFSCLWFCSLTALITIGALVALQLRTRIYEASYDN